MKEPDRFVVILRNREDRLDAQQSLQDVFGAKAKQITERSDGQVGFKYYGADDPLENPTIRSSGEYLCVKGVKACMCSQCYVFLSSTKLINVKAKMNEPEVFSTRAWRSECEGHGNGTFRQTAVLFVDSSEPMLNEFADIISSTEILQRQMVYHRTSDGSFKFLSQMFLHPAGQ